MNKLLLLLTGASLAVAQTAAPVIPLEGLDPVALVKGQQLDGDKKFSVARGKYQYVFASAENKAAFERDPSRYEIQLGGACARMGAPATGSPDTYTVYEGKIYIFGSGECHKHFTETPDKYLEAKQPALKPLPTSAEALANGKALIARAVEGLGGAAALDGVAAYQESRVRNQEVRTIAFPDRYHAERTFNEKIHVAETIADGAGFGVGPNGAVREMPQEAAATILRETRRDLVVLLRARNNREFRPVALDDHTVAIEYMGERLILSLDAATGRVAGLRFFGRGPQGAFGEVARNYSDYRATGKLTLPYLLTQAFDGVVDPNPIVISSIALNPNLPASLFARPQ